MRQDKLFVTRSSRPRAMAVRYLIAVAGAAAVAACGSVAAPASGGGSAPAPPKVSLHITVQNGPGTTPKRWTLRCDPTGGSHPHAAAACSALMAINAPFALPSKHRMCPMILASAKRVTFTGTWFGTKVNRTIVDGGCDLAKWTKLRQVMN